MSDIGSWFKFCVGNDSWILILCWPAPPPNTNMKKTVYITSCRFFFLIEMQPPKCPCRTQIFRHNINFNSEIRNIDTKSVWTIAATNVLGGGWPQTQNTPANHWKSFHAISSCWKLELSCFELCFWVGTHLDINTIESSKFQVLFVWINLRCHPSRGYFTATQSNFEAHKI